MFPSSVDHQSTTSFPPCGADPWFSGSDPFLNFLVPPGPSLSLSCVWATGAQLLVCAAAAVCLPVVCLSASVGSLIDESSLRLESSARVPLVPPPYGFLVNEHDGRCLAAAGLAHPTTTDTTPTTLAAAACRSTTLSSIVILTLGPAFRQAASCERPGLPLKLRVPLRPRLHPSGPVRIRGHLVGVGTALLPASK